MKLTIVIQTETSSQREVGYFAHCPELDIASQGDTREQAHANLREAIELFLEMADPEEVDRRIANGATVATLEVAA